MVPERMQEEHGLPPSIANSKYHPPFKNRVKNTNFVFDVVICFADISLGRRFPNILRKKDREELNSINK